MKARSACRATCYTRRRILRGLGAAVVMCLAPWSLPLAADLVRRMVLDLRDGQLPRKQRTVRVRQGDAVDLHWTTDRLIRLHLHGYNIKIAVSPGAPALMAFKARAAGRFSVAVLREAEEPTSYHRHRHGRTVLYLEVHP